MTCDDYKLMCEELGLRYSGPSCDKPPITPDQLEIKSQLVRKAISAGYTQAEMRYGGSVGAVFAIQLHDGDSLIMDFLPTGDIRSSTGRAGVTEDIMDVLNLIK